MPPPLFTLLPLDCCWRRSAGEWCGGSGFSQVRSQSEYLFCTATSPPTSPPSPDDDDDDDDEEEEQEEEVVDD